MFLPINFEAAAIVKDEFDRISAIARVSFEDAGADQCNFFTVHYNPIEGDTLHITRHDGLLCITPEPFSAAGTADDDADNKKQLIYIGRGAEPDATDATNSLVIYTRSMLAEGTMIVSFAVPDARQHYDPFWKAIVHDRPAAEQMAFERVVRYYFNRLFSNEACAAQSGACPIRLAHVVFEHYFGPAFAPPGYSRHQLIARGQKLGLHFDWSIDPDRLPAIDIARSKVAKRERQLRDAIQDHDLAISAAAKRLKQ